MFNIVAPQQHKLALAIRQIKCINHAKPWLARTSPALAANPPRENQPENHPQHQQEKDQANDADAPGQSLVGVKITLQQIHFEPPVARPPPHRRALSPCFRTASGSPAASNWKPEDCSS